VTSTPSVPARATDISVRLGTLDDVASVASIHVRSWQRTYRGLVPDAELDSLDVEQRAGRWRRVMANPEHVLLVGVVDERVRGFSSLTPSRDPGAEPGTLELAAIYVDPRDVRMGVGRALMAASLATARRRGDHALTLWVVDTNSVARRFYERCGLRWDGSSKLEQRPTYSMNEVRYRIELADALSGK
jgi:GNAT superfamily N-acetyltransferase